MLMFAVGLLSSKTKLEMAKPIQIAGIIVIFTIIIGGAI
jgi:hypothetical protein